MAFDYLESNLSKSFKESIAGRFDEAFVSEVKERSRLLFNLRVPLEEAIDRINKNVEWEFDGTWTGGAPPVHEQTREIVSAVYAHLTR